MELLFTKNKGMGRNKIRQKEGKNTPEYTSWLSMNRRCYSPNWHTYPYYGGRGISVDDKWRGENGFENFLCDMGQRPKGKTLDRYPDKNGNYTKDNCRWATHREQSINRRNVVLFTVDGIEMCAQEFAYKVNIPKSTLCRYLKTQTPEQIADKYKDNRYTNTYHVNFGRK